MNNIINTLGGASIGGDANAGNDVVGRDKNVIQHIQHQYVGISSQERSAPIELVINRNFDEYSETDQKKLLHAITVLLSLKDGDVKITKVSQGSVRLSIELPVTKVVELFNLVQVGALKSYDVVKVSLHNTNLSGANLRGVDLSLADLHGADLSSTDLRGADLRGADLTKATLRNADLGEVNLLFANMAEADLRETILVFADLSKTILLLADLSEAYLTGAILTGAILVFAKLKGANLRGADLQEAYLIGADLQGADLRKANLKEADLQGANLIGSALGGVDLRKANLRRANLSSTNLRKTKLREAKYDEETIWPKEFNPRNSDAVLITANPSELNILGTDFSETSNYDETVESENFTILRSKKK